ncbi:MAG: Lrp/AsnC family transcriptional regulator [Candidatus Altiarchaeota archaeon]
MADDLRILELLEENAGLTEDEIAKMLDENPAKVRKSITDLKKRKIILKSKAIVDWKKAGRPYATAAIQIKVVPQERAGFARICETLAKDNRVTDVFVVTGEYDLLIMIRAESLEEVSDFVTEKLAPKREVVGTYTHIIMSEYKRDGAAISNDKAKRLAVSI